MEEQIKKHQRKDIRFNSNGLEAFEKKVLSKYVDFQEENPLRKVHSAIEKVTGIDQHNFIIIGHFNPYLEHFRFYYGKVGTDELYELTKVGTAELYDNPYRFDRIEKEDPLYDSVLNFLVDKIPPKFVDFNMTLPNYPLKFNFNFNCFEIIND